jgi:hypothetical protein
VDHDAFRRDDAHEPYLACWVPPRLGKRAGRHVDVVGQLKQPDHPPVGSIDGDQRACVED